MDKYLRPSFFWDIGYKALETEVKKGRLTDNTLNDYSYLETLPAVKAVTYQGNELAINRVDTEVEVNHCLLEPMRATDNNRLTVLLSERNVFDFMIWYVSLGLHTYYTFTSVHLFIRKKKTKQAFNWKFFFFFMLMTNYCQSLCNRDLSLLLFLESAHN